MMKTCWVVLCFFVTDAFASELDEQLALVKQVYDLAPKQCAVLTPASEEEFLAGQTAFESMSLSGDRDIACRNCHLDQFGSTDGLPLAIGVGGVGEGDARLTQGEGILVQRNALSLIGRGQPEFTSLFWDGKVQVVGDQVVSQFGIHLSEAFDSPLAVAAVLPLIERDEFIGRSESLQSNDVQEAVEDSLYNKRYDAVGLAVRARLLDPSTTEDQVLADALRAAGVDIAQLELAHIGNAIAAFIRQNFVCKASRWDRYLTGDLASLSDSEKRGAVLFYGKGRCASCHSGPFHSDFAFHSIGAPQGGFGPHSRRRDIGRAGVTNRVEDLYRFRTPPLVEVSQTAPYGHNGIFPELRDIIVHHFNPLQIYMDRPELSDVDYFRVGRFLEARDTVLSRIDVETESDIQELVDFLQAL